ncbi:MAG: FtsX-like permease family protein [Nitrospirales bacterium]
MNPLFFILVRDHLRHRPFRACLTIVGVAIGVAAWLAIRTANSGVYQSFEETVESVVGQATVFVVGEQEGIDEQLLEPLQRNPSIQSAYPLLRLNAIILEGPKVGRHLEILGLDLLAQADALAKSSSDDSSLFQEKEWTRIFSPQTVFLGRNLAQELGVSLDQTLLVETNGNPVELTVRGVLEPTSIDGKRITAFLIMDIASVQWTFGLVGRVHEIHLVPNPGISQDQLVRDVSAIVPSSVSVRVSSRRNGQVEGMLNAFQMNLTMLSGIGLMVGLFLVYNTMAFSVTQHRKEIGILRSVGLERGGIIRLFLLEAGLLGCVGGLLGCVLGVWMAGFLMTLIGESVGELYGLRSSLSGSRWSPEMLMEGTVIGLFVSLAGAFWPSWEASRMPTVQALALNPTLDSSGKGGLRGAAVVAVSLAGTLIFSTVPPVEGIPWGGYGAALCLLIGGTAIGPLLFDLFRRKKPSSGATERLGLWPSLAADQMIRHVGRTSVTLSAIVVGLSIMVGVGLMIHSFRQTVQLWIDQTMVADIIVAPTSWLGEDEQGKGLPVKFRSVLQAIPGVRAVDAYRETEAVVEGQGVALVSRSFKVHAEESRYLFTQGDSSEILHRAVEANGLIVSEVLAQRLGVSRGQTVMMDTPNGQKGFPIIGIFYDYSTDGGKVVMDERLYRSLWPDSLTTVFAVYVEHGTSLTDIRDLIEESFSPEATVSTISNRELRIEILDIFDRTFRVTYVLELIALSVAVLGIVNTLMTAIMERRRELATLRALGASISQIKTLIYWEAGYLVFWGVGIGLAVGMALSLILIKVINKQSFGWTIPWTLSFEPLVMACLVAAIAVFIGAWWPARWAGRQVISTDLRYE